MLRLSFVGEGCINPDGSCNLSGMSLQEIEVALSGLSAEELARVEATLQSLRARRISAAEKANAEDSTLVNGFDVIPRRNGESVTIELVRELCAEEGI